ncbi:MAG: CocE/NonD family hydrolase [Pseudomonadota bacterium]
MPDGVALAGRLFLPERAASCQVPAVLEFLPYRRRDVTAARDEATYPAYMQAGIAGIRVDLRGTGDSGGTFDDEYSEQELRDAEAVIAWIADQPWCTGAVGMMGISWGGFNALQLAARKPPALKAVVSIASTVDRFADDIHFKGGAMMSSNLYWATQMLGRAALPPDAAVLGEEWRSRWMARLESLPSLAARWHKAQRRDAYWQHGSICEDFTAVQIPCLMIAGWADGYRNTPWKARAGMGPLVRAITGPWVHLYPHFAEPGPRIDFVAETVAWWQHWLGGRDTGAQHSPAHRLWLSQAVDPRAPRLHEPGRWISITPEAEDTTEVLHLSTGALHAHPGTGRQTLRTPGNCGLDGGEYFTQAPGDLPGDQARDDALSLCFDTAPLEAELDIIGMPELRVPVALDSPQGHLIARLCDLHPDGTSHRITMGVLNLAHRHGSAAPTLMSPGREEDVTLTLDATAYRLLPGHRLRLALSTAYFPLVLPHPTDATATLDLSRAALRLPCHAFRQIDLPDCDDPRPSFPKDSPPLAERRVTGGEKGGPVTVSVRASSGRTTHPGHGLSWQDDRQSDWSITPDDPLSAAGNEMCIGTRWRDGICTRVEAEGALRVTQTDWLIEARLTAYEDEKEVFRRSWSDRIPRDMM